MKRRFYILIKLFLLANNKKTEKPYFSKKKHHDKNHIAHRTWRCNWKHPSLPDFLICSPLLGKSFSIGDIYNQCHRLFPYWTFYRIFRKTATGQRRLEVVSGYWILWWLHYFFNFWIRELQFAAGPAFLASLYLYCLECDYWPDGGMVWTFCCKNVNNISKNRIFASYEKRRYRSS